jgi:hypothetical protein
MRVDCVRTVGTILRTEHPLGHQRASGSLPDYDIDAE